MGPSTGHKFILLLFLFQFSFFLWIQLGFFLLFFIAFIFLSTIAHGCFSFLVHDLLLNGVSNIDCMIIPKGQISDEAAFLVAQRIVYF